MPQLKPVAKADRCFEIALDSFEALPVAKQLPLLARLLSDELQAGTFGLIAGTVLPKR
jgi:hypothetical protein